MTGRVDVLSGPERITTVHAKHGEAEGKSDLMSSAPVLSARDNPDENPTTDSENRGSPDPSHNTDKYRLVTPFWLHV